MFRSGETRSSRSVIMNVAEMYHIKEMMREVGIDDEPPLIRDERDALSAI